MESGKIGQVKISTHAQNETLPHSYCLSETVGTCSLVRGSLVKTGFTIIYVVLFPGSPRVPTISLPKESWAGPGNEGKFQKCKQTNKQTNKQTKQSNAIFQVVR